MPSPAPLAPEMWISNDCTPCRWWVPRCGSSLCKTPWIPLRALGPNHRHRASGVRAELVRCQAEKCLLLPGTDISPNKLTMPPVAIECVRNIRREAPASFWEACHVAKQNVTKPDQIGFLGFIEDLVRAFDAAMETDKNRYGGT